MVDLGGVFRPFGNLIGATEVTAGGLCLLGCGWGPTVGRMDCLANIGPLQPVFLRETLLGEDSPFWGCYLSF